MVAKLKAEQNMEQKVAFGKSAEIWKTMTDAEKEPYTAKAKADEEARIAEIKRLLEPSYDDCRERLDAPQLREELARLSAELGN